MTGRVPTVRGWIAADQLGVTLMHEHLLVDLAPGGEPPYGAAETSR